MRIAPISFRHTWPMVTEQDYSARSYVVPSSNPITMGPHRSIVRDLARNCDFWYLDRNLRQSFSDHIRHNAAVSTPARYQTRIGVHGHGISGGVPRRRILQSAGTSVTKSRDVSTEVWNDLPGLVVKRYRRSTHGRHKRTLIIIRDCPHKRAPLCSR